MRTRHRQDSLRLVRNPNPAAVETQHHRTSHPSQPGHLHKAKTNMRRHLRNNSHYPNTSLQLLPTQSIQQYNIKIRIQRLRRNPKTNLSRHPSLLSQSHNYRRNSHTTPKLPRNLYSHPSTTRITSNHLSLNNPTLLSRLPSSRMYLNSPTRLQEAIRLHTNRRKRHRHSSQTTMRTQHNRHQPNMHLSTTHNSTNLHVDKTSKSSANKNHSRSQDVTHTNLLQYRTSISATKHRSQNSLHIHTRPKWLHHPKITKQ